MVLVVETGAAMADADAFVSLEDFKAHCDKRGYTYGDDDNLIDQAIVRATAFISESYSWQGWRVKSRNSSDGAQALSWPRYDVIDEDGYTVPADTVPIEIVKATIEVARKELAVPEVMTPSYTPSEQVKREKFDKIEFEYAVGVGGAESVRPVLLFVRDLIGPFLSAGGGSSLSGTAIRA